MYVNDIDFLHQNCFIWSFLADVVSTGDLFQPGIVINDYLSTCNSGIFRKIRTFPVELAALIGELAREEHVFCQGGQERLWLFFWTCIKLLVLHYPSRQGSGGGWVLGLGEQVDGMVEVEETPDILIRDWHRTKKRLECCQESLAEHMPNWQYLLH